MKTPPSSGHPSLANEARPGLGARTAAQTTRGAEVKKKPQPPTSEGPLPLPPQEIPVPVEQDSGSLEQEEQRDTGVSGHSGGT